MIAPAAEQTSLHIVRIPLLIVTFLIGTILIGCQPEPTGEPPSDSYTFFVAGHAYGTPDAPIQGLFPPLLRMFSALNSDKSIELGMLPGDITRNGSEAEWELVDRQLDQLRMPVYKVMGNHDARNRSVWTERYGPAFYSFTHRQDLFIVLDTNNPDWQVNPEQLMFLERVLSSEGQSAEKIFVFCHQLIWASAGSEYAQVHINAEPQRPTSNNFRDEVLPLLQSTGKPTLLFAGDMGAWSDKANSMYATHDNVGLVGTGMGDTVDDELLIVTVPATGQAILQLLNLQTGTLAEMLPHQAAVKF